MLRVVPRVRRRRAPPLQPVPEKALHAAIVNLCKQLGAQVYFTHNSKGSPPGWPDLVIIRGQHMWLWELKAESGFLTRNQAETLRLLAGVSFIHVGVRRPSDWDQIIQELQAA